ncbi:C-C motif chemokine 8 [Clarias gariepinus]|uniref:C-C motif chemokine 8 n=1 Tax=Clarias gariepinus TaxID=13013 RepID=UPI00234D94ED|nr:C-C motif chemokine 8 [Clarias gariepinus]
MKMVLTLHFPAALLLLWLLTDAPKQGAEAFPVTCCLKTIDIKVQRDQLQKYTLQDTPLCPLKAVRVITKKNKTLCLDPSSEWVIKTMAILDNRNTLQGTITNSTNMPSNI